MGLFESAPAVRQGFLAAVDARVKLLALVHWSFFAALLQTRGQALGAFCGSLVLASLGRALFKPSFWKRLLAANGFLVFLWLLLPFSFGVPGETMARFGPLVMTREGFSLAVALSLKALAITAGALAITGSAPIREFLGAAKALGVPEKAASLLWLMTRYVSAVGEEFVRLGNSMRVRGFDAKFNRHTFKTIGNFCGTLLLRGTERAERVRAAMLCRGYRGKFRVETVFKLSKKDLLFFLLMVALTLAALAGGKWPTALPH
ncbi:MAG: cobalt ECF transporter T component CbiQ [Deltaproteobacteria bacterium]|jgi:cobalt/nickel transport system permease protein|nr:cobalt ECF transporter T component CbiQ [Deltaproteobacteria bacterium]